MQGLKIFFKTHKFSLTVILGYFLIIFSYITLSNFSLHPDTADHWYWSQEKIAPAYFLHPPFIAVYFKLFGLLISDPVLSLKFASVLTMSLAFWFTYLATYHFYGSVAVAKSYLLLLFASPYFLIIGTSMNVNPLMILFSSLGFYVLSKFYRNQNPMTFLLLGLVLGVGMMSKYITIIFYVAFYAWIILTPSQRKWLKSWQLYALPVVSLIVFSPVIYANLTEDFVYLKNHLSRGFGSGFTPHWDTLIEVMLLPAMFIYGPLVSFLGIFFLINFFKKKKSRSYFIQQDPVFWFVTVFFFTTIGLFSYSSLKKGFGDPQWFCLAYFFVYVLLAYFVNSPVLSPTLAKVKRYIYAYHLIALTISFSAMVLIIGEINYGIFSRIPLLEKASSNLNFWHVAWDETGEEVEAIYRRHGEFPEIILAEDRNDSAPMSLYMSFHPKFHNIYRAQRNPWIEEGDMLTKKVGFICSPHRCEKNILQAEEMTGRKLIELGEVATYHPFSNKLIRSYRVLITE